MDKKTMNKLLQDLEDLEQIKMSHYLIKMKKEHEYTEKELIRTIIIDSTKEVDENIIKNDPSLINPTFKRNLPQPNTLKYYYSLLKIKKQVPCFEWYWSVF